jgi:hypothetical protein
MKKYYFFFCSLLSIQLSFCQNKAINTDLEYIPEVTEADKKYAHAFQLLDGKWKGQFKIYEDKKRKPKKKIDLQNISTKNLKKKGLELMSFIEVEQEYQSQTPYFQTVRIKDYYPETGKTITAKGVNRVENGQLLCVVIKPDDMVIHDGYLKDKHTIIWQRQEKNPQKVEYFHETVEENFYEIIGWGYYEGDDLELSPRLWFYAKYERQKE